jgi:dipeptidyl aminopeptidase/acylaminoacyl peptidase
LSEDLYISSLLDLPITGSATRSPNGKHIAFAAIGIHTNVDVFYLSLDTADSLISITDNEEYSTLVDWFPDSKSVIISQDVDGNERSTYYRVYLDKPNKLIPITEENPEFFIRGGSISNDGEFLYYSANYNFNTNVELETSTMVRHNIQDGELMELTTGSKSYDMYPEINKQGTLLLYNRSEEDPAGTQYWLMKNDGSDDREILNFGPKAKVEASWHPDGKLVAFTTDHLGGKQLDINLAGLYNSEDKKITWINREKEPSLPGLKDELKDKDLEICYFDEYEPNILILGQIIKTKTHYFLYEMKKEKLLEIPRLSGNISLYNRLPENKWLAGYYSSTQPSTIISFENEIVEKLTVNDFTYHFDNFKNSSLDRDQLVVAEDYEWKSLDKEVIHGWYYPSATPSDKLIVYVHGGPTAHSQDNLNAEIQYYVNRGFNVLDPNYRGSTGYGVKFREKIKEDGWGGREQADIAYGVQSLINEGKIGKGKVAITGTSYGGYSAWCAITKYPDLFDVSIPVCGMTDLIVDYETTRPDLRPYSEEMMGGTPKEVPERYFNGSPVNFIENIKGKLLIIQGANDPNVTPENVSSVEKALREVEVEYETSIYADEGHGIIKKQNRKRKYIEIADFVESWFMEQ